LSSVVLKLVETRGFGKGCDIPKHVQNG